MLSWWHSHTFTIYIYGINLISAKSGSTTTYFNFNAHGDVVQRVNASGTINKTYRYDAFGVEQNPTDSDTNP